MVAQPLETDSVQCASTDGSEQSNLILFAAVQTTPQGYDLLIVDEVGKYIFTLQPDLGNRVAEFDDRLMLTAAGLWNFYLEAA